MRLYVIQVKDFHSNAHSLSTPHSLPFTWYIVTTTKRSHISEKCSVSSAQYHVAQANWQIIICTKVYHGSETKLLAQTISIHTFGLWIKYRVYFPSSDNPNIQTVNQFLSKHTSLNRLLLQYLFNLHLATALARRKLDWLHCREPSVQAPQGSLYFRL